MARLRDGNLISITRKRKKIELCLLSAYQRLYASLIRISQRFWNADSDFRTHPKKGQVKAGVDAYQVVVRQVNIYHLRIHQADIISTGEVYH
jgi:hypothetical protein